MIGLRRLINRNPGTFSFILAFTLSSENTDHATCPPIEVTDVLPSRTRSEAPTTVKLPIAVALDNAPSFISAPYPTIVLELPLTALLPA